MVNKDRTGHQTHAALILSGLMLFNFLEITITIFSVTYLKTGYKVSAFLFDQKYRGYVLIGIVVCALLIMKMNFVLLKKIGYQNIIQEFSSESRRQRILGIALVACYAVSSFLYVFVSWTLPN